MRFVHEQGRRDSQGHTMKVLAEKFYFTIGQLIEPLAARDIYSLKNSSLTGRRREERLDSRKASLRLKSRFRRLLRTHKM
jgi:hypothetical protein